MSGSLDRNTDRWVKRTWVSAAFYDRTAEEWKPMQVGAFARLMTGASRKVRGLPPLVDAWDDGNGVIPWYSARAGTAERALRDACRRIFGTRERAPDWGHDAASD